MRHETSQGSRAIWYISFAVGVIILAIAGYIGYILYPRFQLPAVTGAGLLVLAASAGIASFFSPCSFPLLATLLAREAGGAERRAALGRALRFALALSAGASLFLILAGAAISAGGGSLFKEVTFLSTAGRAIRIVVGAFLIVLGLIQAGLIPISFHVVEGVARPIQKAQARLRRKRPMLGFALFGFGYLLAGFG